MVIDDDRRAQALLLELCGGGWTEDQTARTMELWAQIRRGRPITVICRNRKINIAREDV